MKIETNAAKDISLFATKVLLEKTSSILTDQCAIAAIDNFRPNITKEVELALNGVFAHHMIKKSLSIDELYGKKFNQNFIFKKSQQIIEQESNVFSLPDFLQVPHALIKLKNLMENFAKKFGEFLDTFKLINFNLEQIIFNNIPEGSELNPKQKGELRSKMENFLKKDSLDIDKIVSKEFLKIFKDHVKIQEKIFNLFECKQSSIDMFQAEMAHMITKQIMEIIYGKIIKPINNKMINFATSFIDLPTYVKENEPFGFDFVNSSKDYFWEYLNNNPWLILDGTELVINFLCEQFPDCLFLKLIRLSINSIKLVKCMTDGNMDDFQKFVICAELTYQTVSDFIPDKKSFKKFESYIKCVKCVRKIGDQYECDGIKLIITLVEMKYPDLGNLCQNIYEAIDIGMIGDFDKVSTFIEIGGKLKEIVSNPITKKIIGVDQKK